MSHVNAGAKLRLFFPRESAKCRLISSPKPKRSSNSLSGPVHNPSGGNSRNRADRGMQWSHIETFEPLAARKPCDLTLVYQKRRGLNVPPTRSRKQIRRIARLIGEGGRRDANLHFVEHADARGTPDVAQRPRPLGRGKPARAVRARKDDISRMSIAFASRPALTAASAGSVPSSRRRPGIPANSPTRWLASSFSGAPNCAEATSRCPDRAPVPR
jgi:hypothetical protein